MGERRYALRFQPLAPEPYQDKHIGIDGVVLLNGFRHWPDEGYGPAISFDRADELYTVIALDLVEELPGIPDRERRVLRYAIIGANDREDYQWMRIQRVDGE